mgnify:CR=1 FL=1
MRTTSRKDDDTPILEVEGLAVEFWVGGEWVTAAEDITYTVKPGEVLAIVGESGSGKSVSSMTLLGLLPKNSRTTGSALLNGTEMIGAPPSTLRRARGNDIAVIFQEPMTALNPVLTIGARHAHTARIDTFCFHPGFPVIHAYISFHVSYQVSGSFPAVEIVQSGFQQAFAQTGITNIYGDIPDMHVHEVNALRIVV